MTGRATIALDDKTDRWKWVCPRGHRSWEPTNHHFWCQKCARRDGSDGVFHKLRNRATGNLRERDELELKTPHGPYEGRSA
jgi:5-methylcytosine-specific restriction endonuclease McrA